ncbi:MAG: sigma-70 family RNA polymerase sigma factor [Clostridiales bacterium]|jgi:RNA polymerase sigma-70 factor (ECF subfamily)|nr:sigma-70 family RNA polymerase sigma factor [Clostridiales bacterium]
MEAVRQLVNRAQKQDLAAFEQLVTLYQDRVYALAQKLAGNQPDAQDLAQEAFIRAYRALHSFRGDADFGTWLHRITVNIWLNEKRKPQLHMAVSLDEPIRTDEGNLTREIPSWDNNPEYIVLASQMSDLMQNSLDGLPKEQKLVLLLRELEDMSYDEIAVTLNCSIGTVRSRLSRARDALRKQVLTRARTTGIHLNGAGASEHEEEDSQLCTERRARVRELR